MSNLLPGLKITVCPWLAADAYVLMPDRVLVGKAVYERLAGKAQPPPMRHTDPTFRSLILALAESDPPELDRVGVLADLLEERGDERAEILRTFLEHGALLDRHPTLPLRDYLAPDFWRRLELEDRGRALLAKVGLSFVNAPDEPLRRVLALFPEGPRWRVEQEYATLPAPKTDREPPSQPRLAPTVWLPSARFQPFLLPADAFGAPVVGPMRVRGPVWTDHPT